MVHFTDYSDNTSSRTTCSVISLAQNNPLLDPFTGYKEADIQVCRSKGEYEGGVEKKRGERQRIIEVMGTLGKRLK